ncbi:MAG: ferrous iron transporter B [Calditrichales bacterium]|nr:MAG: ferrous iron transporter B [Calditrichales bacterium]
MNKIFLIGNPNVGKSAIFSRLTGVHVIASNYPGTTVEYSKGHLRLDGIKTEVIDVPGTYGMQPTSRAEEVATEMLEKSIQNKDCLIINVLDSTNLERNLNLTLQLIKKQVPMIVALNFWDEIRHVGVHIEVEKLEALLGVPVVATSGISGEGINTLVDRLKEARPGVPTDEKGNRWAEIGKIIAQVQTLSHRHHTFFERIEDISIHPLAGIPVALLVLITAFAIIRLVGESMISYIFEPLFETFWAPVVMTVSRALGGDGLLHSLLVGHLVNGQVDFVESLGLLSTALFVPLGMVLPYVVSFYFVLSFLEDMGYLPRLGILVDNLMHKLGIHGLAIIPMLLGIGCNVPGAMATRILETKREKFIAVTLMAIAVPCMAQTAMIFGLVGSHGSRALVGVFGTLFIVWVLLGLILNRTTKGESPEIFVEIPPYRRPHLVVLLKKLWMRTQWFLKEAVPFVLVGVLVVNILYSLGVVQFLGDLAAPLITKVMGLPRDAAGAMIIGFLRKDVAVGMLVPLGLTMKQMIIASVVLTMYFPCIATFTVMIKELDWVDMLKASAIMLISTVTVGGTLNLIL